MAWPRFFVCPIPSALITWDEKEVQAKVTELREQADTAEIAVLNTFARPVWLSAP